MEEQEQKKALIDLMNSPMSAFEWFELYGNDGAKIYNNLEAYANYISEYHVEKASEFIADLAMVDAESDEGKFLTKKEFNIENAKNYIVSVNKQSIISTAKEYVELNIKTK